MINKLSDKMNIFSRKQKSKKKKKKKTESRKLKKAITEMKNSTDRFNSRLDRAEERINILERMSEENTQSEAWRPEKDEEQRRESETGR